MQSMRVFLLSIVLTTTLALGATAGPGPKDYRGAKIKPVKIKNVRQGEFYCPPGVLVLGNVVIHGDVYRDDKCTIPSLEVALTGEYAASTMTLRQAQTH
jgi:hypothetical protein